MKVYLLLNGPMGIQTGIEDGFTGLLKNNVIQQLNWFYYTNYFNLNGKKSTEAKIIEEIAKVQPNLIVIFHISNFPLTKEFIVKIRQCKSNPYIVYDEGDMYGGFNKRVNTNLRVAFGYSDCISLRGLGKWYNYVSRFNKNIIYTPHHADTARFLSEPYIKQIRENEIVFIGNSFNEKIFYKYFWNIPGAVRRKNFVKYIDKNIQYKLKTYGANWNKIKSNCNQLPFEEQIKEYQKSWVTIAYEHYPDIPYYFSNRLPMALLAGSLYVCHYHEGYENIFPSNDFIFFFNKNKEAIDIINYLFSLDSEDLLNRSKRARNFALCYFTPQVVWKNFYFNILKKLKISY